MSIFNKTGWDDQKAKCGAGLLPSKFCVLCVEICVSDFVTMYHSNIYKNWAESMGGIQIKQGMAKSGIINVGINYSKLGGGVKKMA